MKNPDSLENLVRLIRVTFWVVLVIAAIGAVQYAAVGDWFRLVECVGFFVVIVFALGVLRAEFEA